MLKMMWLIVVVLDSLNVDSFSLAKEKEIQNKIRETQAKLSGGGGSKPKITKSKLGNCTMKSNGI